MIKFHPVDNSMDCTIVLKIFGSSQNYTSKGKYHFLPTPYVPGLMVSIYHMIKAYIAISTRNMSQ